jgi:hypothetical protein
LGGEAMAWGIVLPLYASGIFWTLAYDTIYAHQVPHILPLNADLRIKKTTFKLA